MRLGEEQDNTSGLGAVPDSSIDSERYSSLYSQTQELLNTQNELVNEAKTTKETVAKKESKIGNLQNELQTIASSISEAKSIKNNAQQQLPKMREAKNILSELRNSNFSEVRTPAKKVYSKVTDAISDLQGMISNMNDYISSRSESKNDLNEEVSTLQQEIQSVLNSTTASRVIEDPPGGGVSLEEMINL